MDDDLIGGTVLNGQDKGRLKGLIKRIESLEEDRESVVIDIREIYIEAKSLGFNPKMMRQVVRLRKMDNVRREEEESIRDLYFHALQD